MNTEQKVTVLKAAARLSATIGCFMFLLPFFLIALALCVLAIISGIASL